MSEPIILFSNGTECNIWLTVNCDRCPEDTRCDLQNDIGTAFWGDGTISQATADGLGYSHEASAELGWACKKRLSLAATPPPTGSAAAESEATATGSPAVAVANGGFGDPREPQTPSDSAAPATPDRPREDGWLP